jgi:magnesium chelatase family protein
VPTLREEDLVSAKQGESSEPVRARVEAARTRQAARQGKPNGQLGPRELETHCGADDGAKDLLKQAIARLNLSARAYHRVIKLARTIADLADRKTIVAAHMAEAIQYRRLDRGS